MAIKLLLILRSSSSPHLYLDTIKELIHDDNELLPQTKKALLLMKRLKKSFVQIPLQMEVIVSSVLKINLERALSPALGNFNYTDWSEENVKSYKADSRKFLDKVKNLYNKMGYDVEEINYDDAKAELIYKDVKKGEQSVLDKLSKKKDEKVANKELNKEVKKTPGLTGVISMPTLNLPKLEVPKVDINMNSNKKGEKKK